jgi:hypothetical protein
MGGKPGKETIGKIQKMSLKTQIHTVAEAAVEARRLKTRNWSKH